MKKTAPELLEAVQERLAALAMELQTGEPAPGLVEALESIDAQLRDLADRTAVDDAPAIAEDGQGAPRLPALRRLTAPIPRGSALAARDPFRWSLWIATAVGLVALAFSGGEAGESSDEELRGPAEVSLADAAEPTEPSASADTDAAAPQVFAGDVAAAVPVPGVAPPSPASRGRARTRNTQQPAVATPSPAPDANAEIDHHTRGEQLLLEFKPLLAIEQLELALRDDPNRADTYYALGMAHHQLRRKGRAAAAFAKLLALDPNHKDAARAREYVEKYRDRTAH